MPLTLTRRRLPIGAEPTGRGTQFRVWAPKARRVRLQIEGAAATIPLTAEDDGYFSAHADEVHAGARYGFLLNDSDSPRPDPASRFQPDGPHGSSQVIDPGAFRWTDASWPGIALQGQVIYEMHVGTFTREGTWAAATREIAELARIGVTAIEVMPIADFAGSFGWGYDGVNLFAPTRLYGTPDDARAFVDAAHAHGVGVILDVVYNHFGPDGNYLHEFSDGYVSREENEWGRNINFDGPQSGPVREFFVANAGYWIDEFHLDGLRLDATQSMVDSSADHVIAAIVRRVREAARGRSTIVVAENEPQHAIIVRDASAGGYGADGLWNDDYHHTAIVAVTGRNDAYYSDHLGTAQELLSAVKYGYLFQGERYAWQRQRRGTPALDVPPWTFVTFVENHDQVANSATGQHLHALTSPGRYRAIVALTLVAPGTPMLFQGQEFAASSPFTFFADHHGELGERVRNGRAQFLSQFITLRSADAREMIPDPTDVRTFERCKLDLSERARHASTYRMYQDLIALRRSDPVFAAPRDVDGAVFGEHAFALRLFGESPGHDRLVLVNLGATLRRASIAEPLLSPPPRGHWRVIWSSDDPRYGGLGTTDVETADGWRVPAESTVVLG